MPNEIEVPPADTEWTDVRRLHEREKDADNARKVATRIERRTGLFLRRVPQKLAMLNWVMERLDRNGIGFFSWAEIRCRSHNLGRYPTLNIPGWKWDLAKERHEAGQTTYFFSCMQDKQIFFIKYDPTANYDRRPWGRRIVRDPKDHNDSVWIRIGDLKNLSAWE